jgi:hypothetical protein
LLPDASGREEFDIEVAREAGYIARSVDEALDKVEELVNGAEQDHDWSAHAHTMLRNLSQPSIPTLVAETVKVVEEAQIPGSHIELPGQISSTEKDSLYVRNKRVPLDAQYVERLLEECRANQVGEARIRQMTPEYVVLEPV